MKLRVENDEIVAAVTALLEQKIPQATVLEVLFTRMKGGQVYATVEVNIGD